ncbi:MAG: SDR family NAD(P)-dependent oxidoreductase [Betaproteobacteria bacterium]
MPFLPRLNPALPPWPSSRVWVIGASSGIGAAIARALLATGARVALSARSTGKLEAVAGVAVASGQALIEPLDFTRGAEVAAAWGRVRSAWSGCDLVLVVAGTHKEIRAWDLTEADADALLEVNLNGPIATIAAVLPALLAQGFGAIGVVSSVAGYSGLPKALIYGASKAALINFTETLYLDLHPKGLGVYLINPGFVKTPLTDRNEFTMPALISAEEAAAATIKGIEAGRFEIHFPHRFTNVLKLLRLLPYRLYFALVHRMTGS